MDRIKQTVTPKGRLFLCVSNDFKTIKFEFYMRMNEIRHELVFIFQELCGK